MCKDERLKHILELISKTETQKFDISDKEIDIIQEGLRINIIKVNDIYYLFDNITKKHFYPNKIYDDIYKEWLQLNNQ